MKKNKMTKKTKVDVAKDISKNNDVFKLVLLIVNLIVVFYSPFVRGLYFETEQLWAELLVFVTFTAFWVMKLLNKDKKFVSTPIEYFSLGLMVMYLISIITAINTRLAISEWLKYCMYFAVFFMITDLTASIKHKIIVLWTLIATASGLCVVGIDSAAGNKIVDMCNNLFAFFHIPVNFFGLYVGDRINSTIQYPNALAAYLMSVLFIALTISIISFKKWQRIIACVSSFIFLLTIIYSLSRGVLILLPVILLVYLIVIPGEYKLKALMNSIILIFSSIMSVSLSFFAQKFSPLQVQNIASNLWMKALFGGVLSIVLFCMAETIYYKVKDIKINFKLKKPVVIIPVFAVLLVLAIIVVNVPQKLILNSSKENQTVYSSTFTKSIRLKPDKKYTLSLEAINTEDNNVNSMEVRLSSRSYRNILFGGATYLTNINKDDIKGKVEIQIPFTVPEDSVIVDIAFKNISGEADIVVDKVKLIDADNGKKIKDIILKYRFLPDFLAERLVSPFLSKSFIERMVFISDGFDMFKDYWILGAGGGAWVNLNFSYQSYLYWSTQPHAYFVQVAIETGIFGFMLLIFLLLSIIIQYVIERKYRKENTNYIKMLQTTLLISIMSLFLHSAADFDLSLSSVYILLWAMLAVFNSDYRHDRPVIDRKNNLGWLANMFSRFNNIRQLKVPQALLIIISAAIVIIPVNLIYASSCSDKSTREMEAKKYDQALEYIKKASSSDFLNADYKIKYANILLSKESITKEEYNNAVKLIEEAKKLNKYSPSVAENLSVFYLRMSEVEKGLAEIDRAVELRPFLDQEWALKIDFYYQVVMAYLNNQDFSTAEKYLDKVLKVIEEVKLKNTENMKPFVFTEKAQEQLERLVYVKDNIGNLEIGEVNKVKFYSINEMDLNNDGISDQWVNIDPERSEFSIENGVFIAKLKNKDKGSLFQTRFIDFEAGKKYKLELVLENGEEVNDLYFFFPGYHNTFELLKKTADGIFEGEVILPSDYNTKDNYVKFSIMQRLEIKRLTIIEE